MKITFILELLLLFAVLAFASARVLEVKSAGILRANVQRTNKTIPLTKQIKPNLRQDEFGDDFIEVSDDDLLNNQNIVDDENFVDATVATVEPDNLADEIVPTEADVQVEAVKPDDATNEVVNIDDENPINKYCTCNKSSCNCCREFSLPIVPIIRGPGCATIEFRNNNRMNIAIKYGDIVLARRKIGAKDTAPICLPLPGGFSRFCGRVYGVGREKDDFKACLGLELRSEDEVEAALRVSCFTFGARGVKVANAEPLPAVENEQGDEDDDDDDILGFGGGDDDDDDEEDDDEEEDDDDDDELGIGDATEDDSEDESPDYTGFSLLTGAFDGLFGGDEDDDAPSSSTGSATNPNKNKKKTKKRTPAPTKPSQVDEDYVSDGDADVEDTDFTKEPNNDFDPDTSSGYSSSATKITAAPTKANKVKNSKKPTVQSTPEVVSSSTIVPVKNPPQNQWSSIAATVAAITNKIKIPNSQAILNSAAITQNVIDDATDDPQTDEEIYEKDVPLNGDDEDDDETNDDDDDDDEDEKDAYRDSDEDDDDEEEDDEEDDEEEIDDEDETGRRNNTKTLINKKKVTTTKLEKNKKKKEPNTLESFFGLKRLLKYF